MRCCGLGCGNQGLITFFTPVFSVLLVQIIGTGSEYIQDSVSERTVEVVPNHEILDFPRHRHEFSFPFCKKKMQPVDVLPCYSSKKNCSRYVTWKEARILFRPKNPYNIIVLHFFYCVPPIQEDCRLAREPGEIPSKYQCFKK
jgi:hypothetical protein